MYTLAKHLSTQNFFLLLIWNIVINTNLHQKDLKITEVFVFLFVLDYSAAINMINGISLSLHFRCKLNLDVIVQICCNLHYFIYIIIIRLIWPRYFSLSLQVI